MASSSDNDQRMTTTIQSIIQNDILDEQRRTVVLSYIQRLEERYDRLHSEFEWRVEKASVDFKNLCINLARVNKQVSGGGANATADPSALLHKLIADNLSAPPLKGDGNDEPSAAPRTSITSDSDVAVSVTELLDALQNEIRVFESERSQHWDAEKAWTEWSNAALARLDNENTHALDALESQLRVWASMIRGLCEAYAQTKSQLEQAADLAERSQNETTILQERVVCAEQQAADARERGETLASQCEELRAQLEEAQSAVANLRSDVEEQSTRLSAASKAAEESSRLAEALSDREHELEALERRLAQADRDNEHSVTVLQSLQNDLRAKSAEISDRDAQISAKNAQLTERGVENSDLRDEIAELQRALAKAEATAAELPTTQRILEEANLRHRETSAALEKAEQTLETTSQQLTRTSDDLQNTSRTLERETAELSTTKSELESAAQSLAAEHTRVQSLLRDNARLTAEISAMSDRYDALSAECEEIRGDRSRLLGRSDGLQREVESVRDDVQRLRAEVSTLEAERERFRAELADVRKSLGDERLETRALSAEVERLSAKLGQADLDLAAAVSSDRSNALRLQKMEEECQRFRERGVAAEERLAALQAELLRSSQAEADERLVRLALRRLVRFRMAVERLPDDPQPRLDFVLEECAGRVDDVIRSLVPDALFVDVVRSLDDEIAALDRSATRSNAPTTGCGGVVNLLQKEVEWLCSHSLSHLCFAASAAVAANLHTRRQRTSGTQVDIVAEFGDEWEVHRERRELQEQLRVVREALRVLLEQRVPLLEELGRQAFDRNSLAGTCRELREGLDRLAGDRVDVLAESINAARKWQEESYALNVQMSRKDIAVDDAKRQVERMRETREEAVRLEGEVEKLEHILSTTTSDRDRLLAETATLRSQLEAVERKAEHGKDRDALAHSLRSTQSALETSNAELRALTDRSFKAQQEQRVVQKKLEIAVGANERLRERVGELERERERLVEEKRRLEGEVDVHSRSSMYLEAELEKALEWSRKSAAMMSRSR